MTNVYTAHGGRGGGGREGNGRREEGGGLGTVGKWCCGRWRQTGVRDAGLLSHFWLLSNATEHWGGPSPLCLKACVFHKGEKGRDYVWLRAWLTQSSSACLLFIKLHLLDRTAWRQSWEAKWSTGSVPSLLTLKMCRGTKPGAEQPKTSDLITVISC